MSDLTKVLKEINKRMSTLDEEQTYSTFAESLSDRGYYKALEDLKEFVDKMRKEKIAKKVFKSCS